MKRVILCLLIITAIILLVINLVGLFMPLRNSDIYSEEKTFFKNDINLTEEQLLKSLERKDTSDEDYAVKANEAVNNGIAHFWLDEGIDKYNLRVPLFENYILNLSSYIFPTSFEKYQFCDYKKAIERGVGLCSQHAIILSELLELNGVESKIIGLAGHVVVMAKIDENNDQWWVLDPDYGVTIKHDIDQIEKDPKIIFEYYAQKGYSNEDIDKLVEIYGKSGNFVTDGALEYSGKNKYYFEKFAYVSIWIVPISFFLLAYLIKKRQ